MVAVDSKCCGWAVYVYVAVMVLVLPIWSARACICGRSAIAVKTEHLSSEQCACGRQFHAALRLRRFRLQSTVKAVWNFGVAGRDVTALGGAIIAAECPTSSRSDWPTNSCLRCPHNAFASSFCPPSDPPGRLCHHCIEKGEVKTHCRCSKHGLALLPPAPPRLGPPATCSPPALRPRLAQLLLLPSSA